MGQHARLNILFVLNPVSGGRKRIDWEQRIRNHFKGQPHAIEFYVLTGQADEISLQYWFQKFQPDRVVAVGGDGTVAMVAKQLLDTEMPLSILPAGSANGMAKELRIPQRPDAAIDLIVNGKIRCCDVIKINENDICLHLSDLGLNARLVKYFDESPWRGMWGYIRMAFKVMWQKKLMDAHIVTGDIEIYSRAYMIVIANASKYGTGAIINPDGKLDDGKFEIVIMRQFTLIQLFKMFWSYRNFNPKKVEIIEATKATITTKRETHFQVDGEFKGKKTRVEAQIIPARLNLLLPEFE